ncbi:ankyrin repeat domain-containing protein [archaeon]|nr:MAG: ankyrin repeat domain-containing protein [archaeon]
MCSICMWVLECYLCPFILYSYYYAQGDASDIKTPDEEPIFLHMFSKALKLDSISGHVKDFDHDSNDRKKVQKILQMLLQYKIDINNDKGKEQLPPLQLAVVSNNLKMITWCIENKCEVEQFNIDNTNALMLAAKYGHVFALAALIRGGCNIQAISEETGRNALHSAAQFGQTRAALFLLRVGVNKKVLDKEGKTAAQLAFDR